jgi:flagellar hook assembly protein FlgD
LTLLGGKEVYVSPTFNSVIDTKISPTVSSIVYPTEDIDDEFYIKFNSKNPDTVTVTIKDGNGKLASSIQFKHSGKIMNKNIDVSKLKEGKYKVVIAATNNYSKTESITIKRVTGLHEF